jgi:protoheme IX farnesyltransferase
MPREKLVECPHDTDELTEELVLGGRRDYIQTESAPRAKRMQHDPIARSLEVAISESAPSVGLRVRLRDLFALTKPRITMNVVFTAFGGYWVGSRYLLGSSVSLLWAPARLAWLLVGMALVVSGANALNMYLERDTDGLMARTRTRPLPTGRLRPHAALYAGLALSLASIPVLSFGVHPVPAFLAAIALVSYVMLYTPMKRRSPMSLIVGAVPGALPPLIGWSAVRGTIDAPGLVLFGIMFFWQIPHFLAIATFRKEEYRAAGLKVLPVVRGDRVTRHHVVRYLAALLLTSLLLVPFGVGGRAYQVTALVLGALFAGVGLYGLRRDAGVKWARVLFGTSMIYLMGVFGALSVS